MHNLTALSLGLPGTPLHGLDEFEPRSRSTPAPLPTGFGARRGARPRAWRRRPQASPARRFAARARRPAPN